MKQRIPHDRLFKELLGTFLYQFLQLFQPESFFLIHLEHEAQNREPKLFPRRMLQYTLHLHDNTGWDVYPIAVLSYSKPKRKLTDRFRIRCAGFEALSFRYRAIQLNRMNWRDYSRTPNPVAAALMSRMGIERQDRPLVKLACLRLLGQLGLPPAQARLIGRFFENYLRLEPAEEE